MLLSHIITPQDILALKQDEFNRKKKKSARQKKLAARSPF
jgi:hypothetical protein